MKPKRLKRAVIKEEFVELTGDMLSAVLLNQFLYWAERTRDIDKYVDEEIQRAKNSENKGFIHKTHGWIYKTVEELKDEVMATVSAKTVKRRIDDLIDNGWVEVRRNPIHTWDKTNQYRANLVKINKDLLKIGYVLQGYKFDLSEIIKIFSHDTVSFRMDKMTIRDGHSVSSNGQFDSGLNDENEKNGHEARNDRMDNLTLRGGHSVPSNGQIDASIGQNDAAIPDIEEEEKEEEDLLHHLPSKTKKLYKKAFNEELNEIQEEELVNSGFDNEMIHEAIKIAALNNAKQFAYIITVLRDWKSKDIKDVEDLNRFFENSNQKTRNKSSPKKKKKGRWDKFYRNFEDYRLT